MRLILFLINSIGCLLVASVAGNDDLTLDDVFPTDRVLDVRITVDEGDWDTIRFQRREFQSALGEARKDGPVDSPYTYVPARVTIDGIDFGEVGIRKKGFFGSQHEERPSLKVKLNFVDKDAELDGLTSLTFNNNNQDTTQMSQFMGYALYNAAGSPAPRCAYARVTVNGKNLGVYSHVETVRAPLLKRGFGNDQGTLYEGTVVDFFAGWDRSFEHKVGDDDAGRARIQELITAVEGKPGNTILDSSATGRAWVPTSDEVDGQWTSPDFDDSAWTAGKNGAGYETQAGYESLISEPFNFREDLHARRTSLYLRFPFDIADADSVRAAGRLLLRMKYDDGFVAYLNGLRIASANAPENPQWNSKAIGSHADEAAVRFEPFDISEHNDKLREGTNLLAIHALNVEVGSTDMLLTAEIETNNYEYEPEIAELVDLDAFYRFWAIEGLLGFWDGYSGNRNNFFVYLNPETDRFHFLPWGGDCLFEKFSRLPYDPRAPLSVKTNGRIAHLLYQTKSGRDRYEAALRRIMEEIWDEESLLAETDRLEKLIAPHLDGSQLQRWDVHRIREFIRTRRAEIERELEGGLPVWTATLGEPPAFPAPNPDQEQKRREQVNEWQTDTIWTAAKDGDMAALKKFLADGVDVNAGNESGDTPLLLASLMGHVDAVRFLIANGANVNGANRKKDAPLHAAAFLGRIEVVELLIQHGADVNITNSNGDTPLTSCSSEWAEIEGFVEFIARSMHVRIDTEEVRRSRPNVAAFLREHLAEPGQGNDTSPTAPRQ